jgi:uncharacterized protein (TIGR03067 family)
MHRLPRFAAALSALLLVAADKPQPSGDLAALQGDWTVETAERGGNDEKEPVGDSVSFSQDTLTIKTKSDSEPRVAKFTLDSSKQPKQIDVVLKRGEQTVTPLGIYSLEKESLRICIGRPGTPRPAEFSTKGEADRLMFVLKRAKKTP